jgi:hypothetical protein
VTVGNTRTMKHRFRKRRVRRGDAWTGFEPPKHSMGTVEGQIEQLGRFARSVNNSRGWRRTVGKIVLASPLLLWAAFGFGTIVILILRLL